MPVTMQTIPCTLGLKLLRPRIVMVDGKSTNMVFRRNLFDLIRDHGIDYKIYGLEIDGIDIGDETIMFAIIITINEGRRLGRV